MKISEQARHEMYVRLEEALGAEAAATLMEHLPPVGWADVATKRDLDVLRHDLEATEDRLRAGLATTEERLRAEMNTTEHRIRANFRAELNAAITSQTRTLMFAIIGSNVTMAALAFAAAAHR